MVGPADERQHSSRSYRPIRDYALIGDCHGSALVARDGSIDWCCLGRFDANPVFCRILDKDRGGFLSVTPVAPHTTRRGYLGFTNILQTAHDQGDRRILISDFMPVGRRPGSGTHNYVDLVAPNWLIRTVEALGEEVECAIRYRPRGFSSQSTLSDVRSNAIFMGNGPALYHNAGEFQTNEDTSEALVRLRPGRRLVLVVSGQPIDGDDPIGTVDSLRSTTEAFWREWIAYCRYRGPHEAAVKRSLLAIKLMTYAPSGAIVASPTTSLPEALGGDRNWDYRHCWLRDAVFALYALAIMGYGGEARQFSRYLPRVCAASAPELRILYGIDGETDLAEYEINALDGYAGSRPVRIGNGAYLQRQIDVYGEILDWAMLYVGLGGRFDKDARGMLASLADYVVDHWEEAEQGIWEIRAPPRHHVHGKMMCWVALDRAIRLLGSRQNWFAARERILGEVRKRGVRAGHLVQAFEHDHADASLLLAPMEAFPVEENVIRSTVEFVERELRSEDFVFRYRNGDSLDGEEGAFFICSLWLVDALLSVGRSQDAKALFERVLGHTNDVGLYSEEIDVRSGEFLGNFPQAYTHLAVVSSAAHIALYEKHGRRGVQGSHADRAKLQVSATLGWRGIWAACRASWRVGRVVSSRASMMRATTSPKPTMVSAGRVR